MAEAEINRRVVELVNRNEIHKDIHVGYYPVFPEVHLSLIQRATVHDSPGIDHVSPFATACMAIEKELGEVIYGHDKDNLAAVTGHLLENAGLSLAVAESCTGGMIAHLITGIAGSSRYFLGGVIAYANSMKTLYLNVDETLLATHGAVSKEVAQAMATGVRDQSGADIAISVTGIAGPDGGTREKPVGTVFVSLATSNNVQTHKYFFTGNRQQIQEITAKTALDLIRKYLLSLGVKQETREPENNL
jgi:nicotinamide-nucleotide amidase